MKGKLRKLAFVLSAIGFTTLSYAENNYYTPRGWDFKLGLDYSQFSNNGTQYANNTLGRSYNIDPHYTLGYELGLGYKIPEKDSDIDFEYSHLHENSTSNVSSPADSPDLFVGQFGAGPYSWAQSKVSYGMDSFDAMAGHKIKLSPTFDVNLAAGLNYTHLTKDISTVASDTLGGTMFQGAQGTSFNGIGPVFDAEGECYPFDFAPGFDVFGGVHAAAPYGTMSSYFRENSDEINYNTNLPDDKIVVPSVGARLGIEYNVNNVKGINLGAQLGYQATEYFNGTKDFNIAGNTSGNLGYQGWFANVDLRF